MNNLIFLSFSPIKVVQVFGTSHLYVFEFFNSRNFYISYSFPSTRSIHRLNPFGC